MKPASRLRFACASSLLGALLTLNAAQATLVGYWDMNKGTGTTVADTSSKNNPGTLLSGVAWDTTTGHTAGDNALAFNGNTSRVDIPITTGLGLTGAFTIALWAKATYLNSYPYLLEFTNDANGGDRQWFFQGSNGGGDQMYMWSAANGAWNKGLGFKEGGGSTADLNWHHYAFSYSSGVVTPYVDGVAKTTQSISGSPNIPSFTHLLIGGKNQAWTSFEGSIDDVVVFNSVESIASIMNGTNAEMSPIPEPGSLLALGCLVGSGAFLRSRRRQA